jgi:adenylate cyclase class 2
LPEEIEIKLPCPDPAAVRRRLEEQGARLLRERHDESNQLWADPGGRIEREGSALRLRRTEGEALLTYKGPARFEGGVKRREEREVRVSDADEAAAILARLGFTPKFRYEKRREEWELAGSLVALDETPIGRFVEIEGDPREIRKTVAALGLDFAEAIPYSYARLYIERRKDDPRLPEDMVFDSSGDGRR